MKNGQPTYLQEAASNGKFNGQIATASGAKTLPVITSKASLDNAQQGSKAGILKKK
jgi:hypothetical protein